MNDAQLLVIGDDGAKLEALLGRVGYSVRVRQDGLEGVRAALDHAPSLIICRADLPGLDGFGVLETLTNKPSVAFTPFIMLGASDDRAEWRRAMNLGADDYLSAPYTEEELLRVIALRLRKATGVAARRLTRERRSPDRILSVFTREGEPVTFSRNDDVVRENEKPHFVYLVEKGRVHLTRAHPYGREYIIAELGPGDIFGLSTVMEEDTFHYTARVASKKMECRALAGHRLLALAHSDLNISDNLLHMLAHRMVLYGDRLVLQAYDSVRRRTALVLCELQDKNPGRPINLRRRELAEMVGSTKESVSRSLSDFRREQLIEVNGREIRVLDAEGLKGLLV